MSIFTILAFIGYGIKTVYNGDTLDRQYWLTAIILICGFFPFYFSESKDKSIIVKSDEEE